MGRRNLRGQVKGQDEPTKMIDDDGVMRDAKEYLKHRNRTQVKATSSGRCGERFARGSAGNYVVTPHATLYN